MWAYGEQYGGWRDFAAPELLLWTAAAVYVVAVRHPIGGWGLPDGPVGWLRAGCLVGGTATAAVQARRILSRHVAAVLLGRRHERLLRPLLRRRLRQWEEAHRLAGREGPEGDRHAAERNRIALARPRSPTWMGDRVLAVESRVRGEYGLDLPSAWPRFWLLLPDGTRAALRAAERDWRSAVDAAAWALLFAVLALAWWPLSALAVLGAAAAAGRARAAVETATDLVEAAVDLYARDLAHGLGVAPEAGEVTPAVGRLLNTRFRKGG
ncbi:hypothetical protein AB0M29_35070 [Streptomyces sp. NPDC051976]|uniref:hypothetical protein n=1 Tax=Streptomyces sp. NPDC051976 TaxID=3154947 RepID=UPI00343D3A98